MSQSAQKVLPLKSPFENPAVATSTESKPEQQAPSPPETTEEVEVPVLAYQVPMAYGTWARPALKDLVPIATLPSSKLPKADASSHKLIIVGDVHGQLHDLERLLAEVGYSIANGDHVVFTGDLINKGPDSAGVVAWAMAMGASAVRGNHEDRVLLAYASKERALDLQATIDAAATSSAGKEDAGAEKKSKEEIEKEKKLEQTRVQSETASAAELAVAESLTADQRKWLANLPVILRVGNIPSHDDNGEFVVVHAGLVPDIPLARQDSWAVMNMRTLVYPVEQLRREHVIDTLRQRWKDKGKEGRPIPNEEVEAEMVASRERGEGDTDFDVAVPTDGRGGRSWSEVWEGWQSELEPAKRVSVVYGHDAKTGLNIHNYTFGLDSGCVKNGGLSALVFEPGVDEHGRAVVQRRVVTIRCTGPSGKSWWPW
ncbi:Metallo-dependent phosphatase-like protein [Xylariales sp. PMI_506]|nr:Metallo-dependent phosphatase-like protein [Xylariales sp. PMI_506]